MTRKPYSPKVYSRFITAAELLLVIQTFLVISSVIYVSTSTSQAPILSTNNRAYCSWQGHRRAGKTNDIVTREHKSACPDLISRPKSRITMLSTYVLPGHVVPATHFILCTPLCTTTWTLWAAVLVPLFTIVITIFSLYTDFQRLSPAWFPEPLVLSTS